MMGLSACIRGIIDPSTQASISVGDDDSSIFSLTAGKGVVQIQNTGDNECWYGDEDVDPANNRGNILNPRDILFYENLEYGFKLYFLCATGKTTILSPIEG